MPKKPIPEFVPPMMAPSGKEPFDSPDWIFEIKLDGYRAITVFDAAGKPSSLVAELTAARSKISSHRHGCLSHWLKRVSQPFDLRRNIGELLESSAHSSRLI